jgi:hypothetical protein
MAGQRVRKGFWCRWIHSCCPPAPAAVGGVTAGPAGGSGEVQVTWSPHPDPDVAWYRVYRSETTGGPYDHAYLVADAPSPLVGGLYGILELGVTARRYYLVSALTADGREGPTSAEVSGAPVGVP